MPPVLLLVRRHAAMGHVEMLAIWFAELVNGPPIALAEKTVGPADDGKTLVGSSMVTSI
ncbi:hypothetical protein [Bradyrhizobium sp. HKCCYLRH1062]|uniref:hypothetical protein n=1 Tax=unclassified Bradyrhizobium TaxID=2631580 RepID=UPI003EC0E3E7